jgi:hypothetical protein
MPALKFSPCNFNKKAASRRPQAPNLSRRYPTGRPAPLQALNPPANDETFK